MTTRKKVNYKDYLKLLNAELKKHPDYKPHMQFNPGPYEKAESITTNSSEDNHVYIEATEIVNKSYKLIQLIPSEKQDK